MDKDIDYSLYLVTNNKNKTEDEFLNIIEKAAKGGITMLQVREKELPLTEFLEIGKKVQKIAKKCHFNTNLLNILFFFKKTLEIPCLKRYISCETLIY